MKLNKHHQLETHQLFPEHIKRLLGTVCWSLPLYVKRSGMPAVTYCLWLQNYEICTTYKKKL